MGQDIYTKFNRLKEEFINNNVLWNPQLTSDILAYCFLNVNKSNTLSTAITYENDVNEPIYENLTEKAKRSIVKNHIQEARNNLINIDTNDYYSLINFRQDIHNTITNKFKHTYPDSIEGVISDTYITKENELIKKIGSSILSGSKNYSKRASKAIQKGNNWKLFLEYQSIFKEMKEKVK